MSGRDTSDFPALVAHHERMAEMSVALRRIADRSGLSRREIARRMGTSGEQVQRMLRGGTYNATVDSLARLALVLGVEVRIEIVTGEVPR
jgi:transcriptional regulator with XRE-family HTH domain